MKFTPIWILTADAILQKAEPMEALINEGTIIMKDFGPITVSKQTQFSKDPQLMQIECPIGYMRYFTTSNLLPLFFAKPTNKGVFPSNQLDLDAE